MNEEWILLVPILVLENPNVLLYDIIVNKNRELTNKVELSLNIEFIWLITVLCRTLIKVGIIGKLGIIVHPEILLLLLGSLDLPLSLRLDGEYLTLAVLIQHLQHEVSKFDGVVQELGVVLLWVEQGQSELRDDAQVLVEHVRREDSRVTVVLFV